MRRAEEALRGSTADDLQRRLGDLQLEARQLADAQRRSSATSCTGTAPPGQAAAPPRAVKSAAEQARLAYPRRAPAAAAARLWRGRRGCATGAPRSIGRPRDWKLASARRADARGGARARRAGGAGTASRPLTAPGAPARPPVRRASAPPRRRAAQRARPRGRAARRSVAPATRGQRQAVRRPGARRASCAPSSKSVERSLERNAGPREDAPDRARTAASRRPAHRGQAQAGASRWPGPQRRRRGRTPAAAGRRGDAPGARAGRSARAWRRPTCAVPRRPKSGSRACRRRAPRPSSRTSHAGSR